jgi:hypothetical protein
VPCFHPLHGYRSRSKNASGKRSITFRKDEGFIDLPVTVPCGQCIGCRLERSRHWAVRCMHEASLYEENCFITLTYDDKHMPKWGSLEKRHFQLFMKKLRKSFSSRKVRYYHCGEYGELSGRPHYHACLFNFDFPDKCYWTTRKDIRVYRSQILDVLWGKGITEIGEVTFDSAAYVARYIMKKVTGPMSHERYQVIHEQTGEIGTMEPEYTTMSRRPGLGKGWYEKWGSEVYPSDEVIMNGKQMKPPRYYDQQYEIDDKAGMEAVAANRDASRMRKDETPERLRVREVCTKARVNLFPREMNDDTFSF